MVLRWGGVALLMMVISTVVLSSAPHQANPLQLPPLQLLSWGVCLGLLLLSYWQATDLRRSRPRRRAWTVLLITTTLVVFALLPGTTNQNLLFVLSACVLPSVLRWRWVLGVIGLQVAWIPMTQAPHFGAHVTLFNVLLWSVVQVVLAVLIRFTTSERLARQDLAEANAQLQMTRALLERTSREAERMRIARDLHDMLGHHLTVLGLDLELAGLALQPSTVLRPGGEPALEAVLRAQAAQRRLMHDVRGTVDALRDQQPGLLDFAGNLQRSVPHLRLHLDLPVSLPPEAAPVEPMLMRFLQESLTNTLRHAHARNLWLSVKCEPGEILVRAHDDGRCLTMFRLGHGLSGLQERFEIAGGRLEVRQRGGGLHLDGILPWDGNPA